MTAPTDITFSAGTKITSQWLNGVNDHVNNLEADPHPEYVKETTLALSTGASLVGYGTQTVDTALNERLPEIGKYALLRAYTGSITSFFVRGVSTDFDGGFGVFHVDASDTTSVDNGGTVLVDANGRRWKRDFSGPVNVLWFGARGDYNGTTGTDNTAAFAAAIATKYRVFIPSGKYLHTGIYADITANNLHIEGDGWTKTVLVCKTPGAHSIHIKNTGGVGVFYTFPTIKNLQLDGDDTNGCGIFGDGIVWYEFENLRITNQGSHGISLTDTGTSSSGSYIGVIRKVYCSSNVGDGLYQVATKGADQQNASWISNCEFQGNANGATIWGVNIVLRDSALEGNSGYGLRLMTTNTGAAYPMQRVSIKDNYFEANTSGHIYVKTRTASGLIQGLTIDDNYYYSPGNAVGYIAVKFDCGTDLNEVSGLAFRGNQFLFGTSPTTIADFGNRLANDCIVAPRFSLGGTPDFSASTKYINLGQAKFDYVKSQTLSGYFLSKGNVNITYSAFEKSTSIAANGNAKFPLDIPMGSSLVQFSVPVETDSTNYTINFVLYGKSLDGTTAHAQIVNIAIASNSGSKTVKTTVLSGYTNDFRSEFVRGDMYLQVSVTQTTPGTFFYLGNPTVFYV